MMMMMMILMNLLEAHPEFIASKAETNHNHVTYPRSTQAHVDARTSAWINQKGYVTFA